MAWVDLSGDGDRKSLCSFDQGKPADSSEVGDWLEGGKVNSVLWGRLAGGMDDRGFAPKTPVKGGIALDEPVFARSYAEASPASQSIRIATD
jgi:hypothetical protein